MIIAGVIILLILLLLFFFNFRLMMASLGAGLFAAALIWLPGVMASSDSMRLFFGSAYSFSLCYLISIVLITGAFYLAVGKEIIHSWLLNAFFGAAFIVGVSISLFRLALVSL